MAVEEKVGSAFVSVGAKVDKGSLDDADRTIVGRLGDIGGKAGKGLAIGLGVGIAGLAGAGGALFALGSKFDDAFDTIRVGTGATGDALAALQGDFKAVAASGPASFSDVGTSITDLNQKLGLSGKPLQDLSTQFLNLSHITGTDLGGNISAVTGLFNNFGISAGEQGSKLDELFRVSQATGVSVADLASSMTAGKAQFAAAGLSFEDSAALLGTLGKAGLDAGAVLPALGKALASAAKDGKDAGKTINDAFEGIKNAPDATAAAGIAMDTFGAKAGPLLADKIRSGLLSFEDLSASIAAGGDTINGAAADTADFAEKFATFKNRILVGLEPLATKVFDGVGMAMDKLGPVADRISSTLSVALPAAFAVVQDAIGLIDFGGIVDKVEPVIRTISLGLGALVAAFKDPDVTSDGFVGVMEKIGVAVRGVVDFFVANWPKIQHAIEVTAAAVKTGLVEAFGILRTTITKTVTVISAIVGYFDRNRDIALDLGVAIGVLAAAFGIYQVAVVVVSGVTKAFAAVQAVLNAVMSANPIALVVIALVALGTAFVIAYQRSETFRKIVDKIAAVFMDDIVPALVDFGKTAGKVFEAVAGTVADAVGEIIRVVSVVVDTVSALWSRFGDNILQVVRGAFDGFVAVVQGAVGIVTGIIDVFVGVFTGDWHQVWDGLSGIVQAAWDAVKGVIGAEIEIVKGIFGGLVDAIAGVWGPIWDGLSAAPAAALGAVADAAKLYLGLLKAEVDLVLDGIGAAFRALPGAILATIVGLASAAKGIGEAIINSIGDGLGAVGGIIGDVVGTFADGLKNVVDKIVLAPLRLALNTMAHGLASVNIPGVGRAFDAASSTIENLSDHLRLAQGGLVYGPVRAIVGDNPNANRDPEVVSPLSDLRAIIAGELRAILGAGGSGAQPLVLQAVLNANAPIYGVDDLEATLNALVLKIAARARAQGALRG